MLSKPELHRLQILPKIQTQRINQSGQMVI